MSRYLYFHAPGVAADSAIPDGVELKQVDPSVVLGQLVAFATDQPWSASLVGDELVWPDDPFAEEGPWVVVLDDHTRDTLAGLPADRLPGLAARWAGIEEFHGGADPARLRTVVEALIELAGRARAAGEPLFCHMSL